MIALVLLGFALSLDNFRVSLAVGALRPGVWQSIRTALVFGAWDTAAPLAGLVLGLSFGKVFGTIASDAGPVVLILYGLYLMVRSLRSDDVAEVDERWTLFGLPFSLSLDNFVAGAGLGLIGFPPVFAAGVFGLITATMTLIGLQLGRGVSAFIPVRADLLGGLALVLSAGLLALGL